jgi:uncharacterized protein (TIGR03435 family)
MAGIVLSGMVLAQPARLTFDAASIKLNPQCDALEPNRGAEWPGHLSMECADLRDLILAAYGVFGGESDRNTAAFRMQVVGGPRWMDSERYDFDLVADGATHAEMLGPMLRSLLEDRFQLKVHREIKEGPIYKLTLAKNGSKLHASKEGSCVAGRPGQSLNRTETSVRICGSVSVRSNGAVDFYGATMTDLCTHLSLAMDREVTDDTGLEGKFDLHLEINPSDLSPRFIAGRDQFPGHDDVETGSSVFGALERQLGLKLAPARGAVSKIVVDGIERPTGN